MKFAYPMLLHWWSTVLFTQKLNGFTQKCLTFPPSNLLHSEYYLGLFALPVFQILMNVVFPLVFVEMGPAKIYLDHSDATVMKDLKGLCWIRCV